MIKINVWGALTDVLAKTEALRRTAKHSNKKGRKMVFELVVVATVKKKVQKTMFILSVFRIRCLQNTKWFECLTLSGSVRNLVCLKNILRSYGTFFVGCSQQLFLIQNIS